MENAGLITYGLPNLLVRPGAADARFRRRAANIGAHEIAHQWFGNLVTPAWWDDIWLNEVVRDVVRRQDGRSMAARLSARRRSSSRARRRDRRGHAGVGAAHSRADRIARRHLQRVRFDHVFERRDGDRHVRGMDRRAVRSSSAFAVTSNRASTGTRLRMISSMRYRQPAAGRSRRRFRPFSIRTASRSWKSRSQCDRRGARLALAQQRLSPLGGAGRAGSAVARSRYARATEAATRRSRHAR